MGYNDGGENAFPSLYDQFDVTGPNGTHMCLVMPLLGPALEHLMLPSMTQQDRRTIAVQLIDAVSFRHHSGVVHGGELVVKLPSRRARGY